MRSFTEDDLKIFVTWASISYGFGFFTVMLHTARLGFPVLELISAVYIWIGFPLTVIAFFSKKIYDSIKTNLNQSYTNISNHFKELAPNVQLDNKIDIVSKFISTLIIYIPIINFWPEFFTNKLRGPFDNLFEKYNIDDKAKRKLQILIIILNIFNNISIIIRNIIRPFLIVGVIFLYIWVIYPSIPQSLGGGAPQNVKLIIDAEKLSINLPIMWSITSEVDSQDKYKTIITEKVQLIYKTKDEIYIKTKNGIILSLSNDTIKGVIWSIPD